jgi:2-polyprenyl-3-methyl-5-hydroxy-6-metoxy-1,4-benzoquinol methylase
MARFFRHFGKGRVPAARPPKALAADATALNGNLQPRELPGAVGRLRFLDSRDPKRPKLPTQFKTPKGAWEHTAAIPLSVSPGVQDSDVWVRIRARVLSGRVAFGLHSRAADDFQDRQTLTAGAGVSTTYLHIADAAHLDQLIIQNATPDGESSELLLEEVTVHAGDVVHDPYWQVAWPVTPGGTHDPLLRRTFEILRQKWGEVPATDKDRTLSANLLELSDQELLAAWEGFHTNSVAGDAFPVRGWFEVLYKDVFRGHKVLDFGCGLAINTLPFAEHGSAVTFVDIVPSNVEVVRRLCGLKNIGDAQFCYLEDLDSLAALPADYDFVFCCGSLINAPLEVTRLEAQAVLKHLKAGGRWIELAYPKSRWEREGRMPFDRWGEKTDGGAPWMEWHDLQKLEAYLAPAIFEVVLELEFHDGQFNWFDLIRRA